MIDKKCIIRNARNILKKHGGMAAVVLAYRLKEDCFVDIETSRLVQLIRIYGKDDISSRKAIKERGFGSYRDSSETLIYEAR